MVLIPFGVLVFWLFGILVFGIWCVGYVRYVRYWVFARMKWFRRQQSHGPQRFREIPQDHPTSLPVNIQKGSGWLHCSVSRGSCEYTYIREMDTVARPDLGSMIMTFPVRRDHSAYSALQSIMASSASAFGSSRLYTRASPAWPPSSCHWQHRS